MNWRQTSVSSSISLFVSLALISLVVISCGKAPEEELEKGNPLSDNIGQENKTNQDVCEPTNPKNASLYQSSWKLLKITDKNVVVQENLKFDYSGITKTVYCTIDATTVAVTARATVSVNEKSREFVISSNDQQEKNLEVGRFTHLCKSSLQVTVDPVKYSFTGPCLNLVPDDDRDVYVPGN